MRNVRKLETNELEKVCPPQRMMSVCHLLVFWKLRNQPTPVLCDGTPELNL